VRLDGPEELERLEETGEEAQARRAR